MDGQIIDDALVNGETHFWQVENMTMAENFGKAMLSGKFVWHG